MRRRESKADRQRNVSICASIRAQHIRAGSLDEWRARLLRLAGAAASARFCALAARCAFSQSGHSVCFTFEGAKTLPQLAHFTFSLLMWRAPRGVG